MAYDIRLPNITATTEKGKLEQMQSYLYQFAEQLKYAVNIIDSETAVINRKVQSTSDAIASPTEQQKLNQFNNLKNLIISSADIVDAYSEKISYELNGKYVAQSEYGEFERVINNRVEETAEATTAYYELLQEVNAWKTKTSGYIKTGLLGTDTDGKEVFGVEVGHVTVDEYNTETSGAARFTPDKIKFYDKNMNEMAEMTPNELIINGIRCRGNLFVGDFVIDTINGFAIKPAIRGD